jgi:hypothetical protein
LRTATARLPTGPFAKPQPHTKGKIDVKRVPQRDDASPEIRVRGETRCSEVRIVASLPDPSAVVDRPALRAGARRERRAEFERRLAEPELTCTCRGPEAIDAGGHCVRCYARRGVPRHISHPLAKGLNHLDGEAP